MASETTDDGYFPTYREQDIDETLEDHEVRISNLEKAALIGAGYAIAEAPDIVSQLVAFL